MDGGSESGSVGGGGVKGGWEWDGGIGTPVDEGRGDVQMAIVRRPVEGSVPMVVLLVDRCIPHVGEEGVDDIQMAIEGRIVEGSPPIVVLRVYVCPSLQQLGDACNIPLPTRIVQSIPSPVRHYLSTTRKPRHDTRQLQHE